MPEALKAILQKLSTNQSIDSDPLLLKKLFSYVKQDELLSYFLSKDKNREYLAIGRTQDIKSSDTFRNLDQEIKAIGTHYFEEGFHYIVPSHLLIRSGEEIKLETYNSQQSSLVDYFNFHEDEVIHDSCDFESEEPNENDWHKLITETTEILNLQKNYEKVVLGKKLILKTKKERNLKKDFLNLSEKMPSCHHFYLSLRPGVAFLCLSPETLYRKQGNVVSIDTLAGTRARGKSSKEDKELEQSLMNDPKDNREHKIVSQVIVDKLKNLGKLTIGNTKVLKLENVQHLHTPIVLETNQETDPLQLASLLHPTPALGGHPFEWACDYIKSAEPFKRNMFAAPMGLISKDNTELIVGIRSALYEYESGSEKSKISIFGGCGIVADSDPKLEWNEINAKIGFIKDYFTKGRELAE